MAAAATAGTGDEGARAVLATVLASVGAARRWPLDVLDLALSREADGRREVPPVPEVPAVPAGLAGPDVLGSALEAVRDADHRRSLGVHHTPPPLAAHLVAWATDDWDVGEAGSIVDPAVGGGAFLLAAARWSVGRGRRVAEVLAGLGGVDVDPLAVAVAEAALVGWALDEGLTPVEVAAHRPTLVVGDGLALEAAARTGALAPDRVDLVVGNPPFLGQLQRATARERTVGDDRRRALGAAASGYVDDAALFLLVACRWVRPGGRVVLVQPESVLGARDAEGVRSAVAEVADLVGLWTADGPAFAAQVEVCAPVLQVRRPPSSATGASSAPVPSADDAPVRGGGSAAIGPGAGSGAGSSADHAPARRAGVVALATGVAVRPVTEVAAPSVPTAWASLLASARGVPPVVLDPASGTIGDRAGATAGFRQHFYGLAPSVEEAPDGWSPGDHRVRVVTAGAVDPLELRWGTRPSRIGGRSWSAPVVDLAAVESADPVVGRWWRDRLRPKVLVAPQTRVVEAVVDVDGSLLPAVPVVSLEPLDDDVEELWLLAAALSAPPVTAWALHQSAGTARSRGALKLAARQVRAVPLPVDDAGWRAVAADLRSGRPLGDAGADLAAAYGLARTDPVVDWWRERLARSRRR